MEYQKKKSRRSFPKTQSNIMPMYQPYMSYAPMGVAEQAHPVRIAPPGQMLDQNTAAVNFYDGREEQIPNGSHDVGATHQDYSGGTAFFQR